MNSYFVNEAYESLRGDKESLNIHQNAKSLLLSRCKKPINSITFDEGTRLQYNYPKRFSSIFLYKKG